MMATTAWPHDPAALRFATDPLAAKGYWAMRAPGGNRDNAGQKLIAEAKWGFPG